MKHEEPFSPDWASPPGETISDMLDERDLALADLAAALEVPASAAQGLLTGELTISEALANGLAGALGASPAFWMRREEQYRSDLERLAAKRTVDHTWLSELPLRDMAQFGWLELGASKADKMAACLDFFGVASVEEWRSGAEFLLATSALRTSHTFNSQRGAISAWLRQGEREASQIACARWSGPGLESQLPALRQLTRKKDPARFLPELRRICAECGVAVAIVRSPTGCRASGATRFLNGSKALLLLSFRYLSEDHFWFTFFHEIGHLVLHGPSAVFLEGLEAVGADEEEQANRFSARTLIPEEYLDELRSVAIEPRAVIHFAHRVGVSPGIVVGQLRHLGRARHNQLSGLIRRFQWA